MAHFYLVKENLTFTYARAKQYRFLQTQRFVLCCQTPNNVGIEFWGFMGEVYFELY